MTKKGKRGILETAANKEKVILYRGIEMTVVFMATIGEVKKKLKQRGELTEPRRIEMDALVNASAQVLEFFKTSGNTISNIVERIKPEYVEKESERMYKDLTTRIIMPGQERAAIIIPQLDARNVIKDLKSKKDKK